MANHTIKGLITGIFCLTLGLLQAGPARGDKTDHFSATLTDFKGAVTLQKGGEKIWLPVLKDMPLEASDRLKTGADSFAEILVDDGSLLKVEENSEILLTELSADFEKKRIESTVYVKIGRLMSRIAGFLNTRSRFTVKTPTVVAGVRGTEFAVVVEKSGKTDLAVVEGKVAVARIDDKGVKAKGPMVLVMGGMQTMVRLDGAPLPPSQLQGPMMIYRTRFVGMRQRAVEMKYHIPQIRNRRPGVYRQLHKRWEEIRKRQRPKRHGVIPGAPPPSGKGGRRHGVIPGAPPPSGRGGNPHGVIPGAPPPSGGGKPPSGGVPGVPPPPLPRP